MRSASPCSKVQCNKLCPPVSAPLHDAGACTMCCVLCAVGAVYGCLTAAIVPGRCASLDRMLLRWPLGQIADGRMWKGSIRRARGNSLAPKH